MKLIRAALAALVACALPAPALATVVDNNTYNLQSYGAVTGDTGDQGPKLALACVGAPRTIYEPRGTYRVASNETIPAGIHWQREPGALWHITSGHQVVFNGPLEAERRQLFVIDDLGTVPVVLHGAERDIAPQVFGAVEDGTTDDTLAVQAAVDVALAAGIACYLPPGNFHVTSLTAGACRFSGPGLILAPGESYGGEDFAGVVTAQAPPAIGTSAASGAVLPLDGTGHLAAAGLPLGTTGTPGALRVGSGLAVAGGVVSNAGVTSFQGRTGAVTLQAADLPATGVVTSFGGRAGAVTLGSSDVTGALGYTPAAAGSGVTTWNGRTGAVTLGYSDVTTALGYTPGTVSSVALTMPGVIFNASVSGSPVTGSGTLAPTLATQVANTVLAGPTSGSATPTFRALVAADLPGGSIVNSFAGRTGAVTLGASDVTAALGAGGLLDSNLSSNVPLKNAVNTFTAAQTITASSGTGLTVTDTAASGVAEVLQNLTISDDATAHVYWLNGTSTNGIFQPLLRTIAGSTTPALTIQPSGTTDSGPNGVLVITPRIGSSAVVTRPLIDVQNNSTSMLQLLPSNSGAGTLFSFTPAANIGPPTVTTHSVGERISLYPTLDSGHVDIGFGIETGGLWSAIAGVSTATQFNWYAGTVKLATLSGVGNWNQTQQATSTGAYTLATWTAAASTGLTASTEVPDLNFNLARTVTWATSTPTTQRAMLVQAPTYACDTTSASITDAATIGITGPPSAGTNVTTANAHGLLIGTATLANTTNGYGLTVNSPTGATNNWALNAVGTAITGTAERIAKFGVSDASGTGLSIANAYGADGHWGTLLNSTSTSTDIATYIRSTITSDSGTNAATNIDALIGSSALSTRPLLNVTNNGTAKLSIAANGAVTNTITSASSTPETAETWKISDDVTGKLIITNGTSSDNVFIPWIQATSSGTNLAAILSGEITTDTGTNPAVMLDGRLAAGGAVATRPLLVIANNGTTKISVAAGGSMTLTGGSLILGTAGQGIQIKSGTNARAGTATLVGGTVTVSNTSVTANTVVRYWLKTAGGTVGSYTYTTSAGTGFTITSSSGSDTSTLDWELVEVN